MSDQTNAPLPLGYKLYAAFTTIACIALSGLLIRANRANESLQHSFSQAIEKVGSAGIAVGESVVGLVVAAAAGLPDGVDGSDTLAFDDGRSGTLLLIVSGGCDTCRFSYPYFARLAAMGETHGLVAAAIQVDAVKEQDFKTEGLAGFPIVAVEDSARTWLRRVPIVPAILLIDPRGAVLKTYFGELSPKQQEELEAQLAGMGHGGQK